MFLLWDSDYTFSLALHIWSEFSVMETDLVFDAPD